jgi:hypothetical protein
MAVPAGNGGDVEGRGRCTVPAPILIDSMGHGSIQSHELAILPSDLGMRLSPPEAIIGLWKPSADTPMVSSATFDPDGIMMDPAHEAVRIELQNHERLKVLCQGYSRPCGWINGWILFRPEALSL